MKEKIRVGLKDHSSLQIECDRGIAQELSEHFSFEVPGYKFMPAYRHGAWDGKIRLYDGRKSQLPAGLFKKFQDFARKFDYNVELEESSYGFPGQKQKVDPKEVWDFIQSLNLHSGGKKIEIRDYQFDAVCRAIEDERLILLSPTGSGKSLIIYVLMRWYRKLIGDYKQMIIVPTTSLVEQMYTDFEDYSSHDDSFEVSQECHRIFSGKEKTNVHNPIFISTWQSIYKLPVTWFRQFRVVFGDEAHGFKAKTLTDSMKKAQNARYRIGTTGTLDNSKTHHLVLEGSFGAIRRVTKTKTLQDKDTLAQLDIKMLYLKWPEDTRSTFGRQSYQKEIDWIVRNERRNAFIEKLALDMDGNTLILFQFVDKHGRVLYDRIRSSAGHRVFFVSGEVETDDREAIRRIVEGQKKSTVVASSGVFSTGVNMKNIHNLILASPTKSQIKLLQSIGRSLRKADNGKASTLIDIVDDISWNDWENYALRHGKERQRIYDEEEFTYRTYRIDIK